MPAARHRLEHPGRELVDHGGQRLLGHGVERAGGYVVHQEARLDLDHRRQVGRPGPGEDVAGDAGPGQRGGQLPDIDVHATPVARAWLSQRGRVQRQDGKAAHGVAEPTGGPE